MNNENLNEEKQKIYLQSINYETLLKIVKDVNIVDTMYIYSMPNHIKTYAKDVEKTTQTIFSFFENEDERWRATNMKRVDFAVNEDTLCFGGMRIVDVDLCICMPITNSIIVIPGPETIKLGWDVTKIIQFSNMISLTPMLLRLTDMEDEENPPKHKVAVTYEVISK